MSAKTGNKSKELDLTTGSIPKKLFLFAMPLLFGNLLQQIYFIADSIIVGRFIGDTALAAVGAASAITILMVNFFAGLGNGAGVVIAQFVGAGDKKHISRTIRVAAIFTAVFGILTSIVGIVLCERFLIWTSTPEDVFMQADKYLTVCLAGMLPMLIYNMGAAILQAMGDSKTPLYFLCVASVINVVLDLVFVVTFQMDVEGTAIATCIAQIVSAVLVCITLAKKVNHMVANGDSTTENPVNTFESVTYENENLKILKRIMALGLPIGIQSVVINFSNIVVQSHINSLGSDIMAAWSALSRVDGFVILPMLSFGLAMMTYTGQNYGAKKPERILKGLRVCLAMSCTFTIGIGLIVCLFAPYCFNIFTESQTVIDYACNMVYNMVPFYFMLASGRVYMSAISGTGNSIAPMVINILFMCVFRVVFLPGISLVVGKNLFAMYCTYWVSWVLSLVTIMAYYYISTRKKIAEI